MDDGRNVQDAPLGDPRTRLDRGRFGPQPESMPSSIPELSDAVFGPSEIGRLMPAGLRRYAPAVHDALWYFIGQLSAARQTEIALVQLALPAAAGIRERLVALFRQCPTLHKLGQVLAREPALDPQLRRRLQSLESLPATGDDDSVRAALLSTLRGVRGITLGRKPIAEGSVAVVIPFTVDGTGATGTGEGVFKVLKPGIDARLEEELAVWERVGTFLEARCEHYKLPPVPYRNTVELVARLLRYELRLDQEQAHLRSAAALYAGQADVRVPRLYPWCSERVTAMERIWGDKVTETEDRVERRRRASLVVRTLLAAPFWHPDDSVPFHGDPHAGNLFVNEGGALSLLDWSLTAQLSKPQRLAVLQAVLGALYQDEAAVRRAVAALGRTAPQETVLRAAVAEAVAQVRRGIFPGIGWLTGLLDRVALGAGMSFDEDMTVFRKALLTVSGVVADLGGSALVDPVMLSFGSRRFIAELGARSLAAPGSHAFATHLSNIDLLEWWVTLPTAAARLWVQSWRDLMGAH